MSRAIRAIAVVAIVLSLMVGGVVFWGKKTFEQAGPLSKDTVIVIERGSGLRVIASKLADAGVIRYPTLFIAKAKWNAAHRDLKAGEYAFKPAVRPIDVLAAIREGRVIVHKITIPEGLTSQEVAKLIEEAPRLSGTLGTVPPEGTVLPETYDYIFGDSRSDLLRRMMTARNETLMALWQARAEGLPLANPEAAVVLASIVEKETGLAEERQRVAAVFINRLRRGMRLQSDPTVVYALTGGKGPLGRRLTRRDLAVDNPYNTYVKKGLPPGPIANPGTASLEAVLQPAVTGDLYFVADGSGGHAFAKTLREHNRNVARWRRLQRERRGQKK